VGSGLAGLVASQGIAHLSSGLLTGGFAAGIVGLVGGIARRQGADRDHQIAELGLEHQRLELEQARGEVLAERNRVAREVHDVLAHTLGALAVQLEAADALVGRPGPAATERLGEVVRQSRELVVSGLDEARRAVRALRDEPLELVERLERLVEREPAEAHAVAFAVLGEPRALAPASASALYRAAQEGLANARKHAAGAPVELTLAFEPDAASLTVDNGPGSAAASLARSGSGVGLAAMRERVELAGGSLDAAASGGGWRVVARVPG
ncbi:MAG TPA: histidine kinase, partial [Acidimicrobiales bacterium]|nr:histidine kinase [Acidimicrobiales bacterium]